MTSSAAPAARYRERLTVPPSYWGIGLFFGLTSVTAVTFMLGDVFLVLGIVVVVGVVAWTLLAWGSLTLIVDENGVRSGRSLLEWPYVGAVAIADREIRGRVLAREDVFLALRPYAGGAVVVGVSDDADPHLCWLVSSRDPEAFLRAVEANRPSGAAGGAAPAGLDSGA